MLSKKLNDPFYWKDKQDELGRLPGYGTVEKNILWERLNERLQKKSRNTKAVWYWAAAAVLPLIITTLLLVTETDQVLVAHVQEGKENRMPVVPVKPPAQKETTAGKGYLPDEKKRLVTNFKKKDKTHIIDEPVQAIETIVVIRPAADKADPGVTTGTNLLNDSAITMTATTMVKEKLQVLHINELGTFPEQYASPANFTKKLVPVKAGNRKTNNQINATQQYTVGFRINLSPKN